MATITIENVSGIPNIVAQLRRAKNIRQGDLAKKLKVSRQTVSAIENGHYFPSLPLAFRIAEFFGLAIEEIFNFDSEAFKSAVDAELE